MSVWGHARARIAEIARGLAAAVTLRRHERRRATYVLRLVCLAALAALPLVKLAQLGPAGGALALVKVAAGVALAAAALFLALAAAEWLRRRRDGGEAA